MNLCNSDRNGKAVAFLWANIFITYFFIQRYYDVLGIVVVKTVVIRATDLKERWKRCNKKTQKILVVLIELKSWFHTEFANLCNISITKISLSFFRALDFLVFLPHSLIEFYPMWRWFTNINLNYFKGLVGLALIAANRNLGVMSLYFS